MGSYEVVWNGTIERRRSDEMAALDRLEAARDRDKERREAMRADVAELAAMKQARAQAREPFVRRRAYFQAVVLRRPMWRVDLAAEASTCGEPGCRKRASWQVVSPDGQRYQVVCWSCGQRVLLRRNKAAAR